MHLVEDTVVLPDGNTTTYLRHAATKTYSVAIIAINEKNEMLLQKEYSYPPDEIMWQLPGGEARPDEDILTAANRELSEESGFVAKTCKEIGSYYVNNRRSDLKQRLVLCTDLREKIAAPDAEEFIDTYWIPVSRLPEMVASGEFNNINLLAALTMYFSRIRSSR